MASKKSEDVKSVDVFTAKGLLSAGHKYLDVRTKEEFEKGHVEDALNVPYMFMTERGKVVNPEFLDEVSLVCSKEDQLIVACQGGGAVSASQRGSSQCSELVSREMIYMKLQRMGSKS